MEILRQEMGLSPNDNYVRHVSTHNKDDIKQQKLQYSVVQLGLSRNNGPWVFPVRRNFDFLWIAPLWIFEGPCCSKLSSPGALSTLPAAPSSTCVHSPCSYQLAAVGQVPGLWWVIFLHNLPIIKSSSLYLAVSLSVSKLLKS